MLAKLIKPVDFGNGKIEIAGGTYNFKNNDWNPEAPISTLNRHGYQWAMSHEFFREHFEPIFSMSASDMIFNHDEAGLNSDFASLAALLNGIINENGGFAFYSAADVEREFESRL